MFPLCRENHSGNHILTDCSCSQSAGKNLIDFRIFFFLHFSPHWEFFGRILDAFDEFLLNFCSGESFYQPTGIIICLE